MSGDDVVMASPLLPVIAIKEIISCSVHTIATLRRAGGGGDVSVSGLVTHRGDTAQHGHHCHHSHPLSYDIVLRWVQCYLHIILIIIFIIRTNIWSDE